MTWKKLLPSLVEHLCFFVQFFKLLWIGNSVFVIKLNSPKLQIWTPAPKDPRPNSWFHWYGPFIIKPKETPRSTFFIPSCHPTYMLGQWTTLKKKMEHTRCPRKNSKFYLTETNANVIYCVHLNSVTYSWYL